MSKYVKAESELKHSVIYTDETGKYFRFSGGSRAWRNNNPGNIVPGDSNKRNNQIGVANKFAVFPDYESGHQALLDLLRTKYAENTIPELVKKYAPKKENNVAIYTKFLRDKTGILDDKKVKDFSPEEFEKLWKAIEQMEGTKAGTVIEVYKIQKVIKEKGEMSNYQVNTQWLTKNECLKYAHKEKLDVEICTSSKGSSFIKARPDSSFQKKLSSLIIKKSKEQIGIVTY